MTSFVNTTISRFENGISKDKIEDITDLQALRAYACPKNQHLQEWYLKCLDCKSRFTCRAGKQVEAIMDRETAPAKKKEIQLPDRELSKKEQEIVQIFGQEDPVKPLLEGMSPDSKTQAIYKKVSYWKAKYPEMEKIYCMLEKVRFAITQPYDRMSVAETYRERYGKELPMKSEEPKPVEKKNEKPVKVKSPEPENDELSLEDFLNEIDENEPPKEPVQVIREPVQKKSSSDLSEVKEQLEKEKASYQKKIQEIDKKLEAIRTVESLLK